MTAGGSQFSWRLILGSPATWHPRRPTVTHTAVCPLYAPLYCAHTGTSYCTGRFTSYCTGRYTSYCTGRCTSYCTCHCTRHYLGTVRGTVAVTVRHTVAPQGYSCTAVPASPPHTAAPFLRPLVYCTWEATVRSPPMGERSQPLIPVLWLGYFRRLFIATS